MNNGRIVVYAAILVATAGLLAASCGKKSGESRDLGADGQVTALGTFEVTARLVEIPDGAIFKRDLYNYATILKYQVLKVHRCELPADVVYVGHYNPWKPRAEAADQRVPNTGGDLRQFAAGQVHRMALDVQIDDHFMGGIINKYFGQDTGPLYWAAWTNLGSE